MPSAALGTSFANTMKPAETLRARLVFWYVGALTLTLSAFALLLYGWLSQTLYRHHDGELESNATRIVRALHNVQLDEPSIADALQHIDAVPRMLMVRDQHGDLIYRTPLLSVAEPTIGRHEALVHAAAHAPADPEFFAVTLERLGLVRFICSPLRAREPAYLQIGNPLGDVAATLRAVSAASIVLVPLIVVVTSLGGWLMAGRALAPLGTIDVTLRNIQATDLAKRVNVHPADRELHALVGTINELLGRLQRSFEDLRRFAAEASHQLQTPLAIMRGSIEFIRRSPDTTQTTELLDGLEQEIGEMSATVADLQSLSLADVDSRGAHHKALNLTTLCLDAIEIVAALGESRGVSVTHELAPDVQIVGNSVQLKQVLINLGENGVKYTDAGGVVGYQLRCTGAQVTIIVTDTGPGIDPADLAHIFDPFYRGASVRGAARGSGLGLAIVKRLVEVHGGSIAVASGPGQGTRFAISLPRHASGALN